MHSIHATMCQMQSQMEEMFQVLQTKVNSDIPSNTKNNIKIERKEYVKAINLCLGVVLRDLVRQTIVVIDEEEDNAPIPNVEKGVIKGEEDKNEIRVSNAHDKEVDQPSMRKVPFSARLEEKKRERMIKNS
ncbi:hypothetical protein PVK06_030254 [Gossypium arboreum]|uniref:Uncharacterized protein n=1 Tax=Gossypium arboreum TaxID=29729 RepID=A0ABR0NQ46_GOSAR|nr:hypothetical protein PVK06_030254 [Gossypium arboreum]